MFLDGASRIIVGYVDHAIGMGQTAAYSLNRTGVTLIAGSTYDSHMRIVAACGGSAIGLESSRGSVVARSAAN